MILGDIKILDNFLIPLIEDWFSDKELIFQNDNASCHRVKAKFVFFSGKGYKSSDIASKQSRPKTN